LRIWVNTRTSITQCAEFPDGKGLLAMGDERIGITCACSAMAFVHMAILEFKR